MTFPTLIFGILLAALLGAAFHFWRADSLPRLVLYILLAEVGFWTGHFLANALDWKFATLGALNTGMAILVGVIFLFVGRWLSQVEISRRK